MPMSWNQRKTDASGRLAGLWPVAVVLVLAIIAAWFVFREEKRPQNGNLATPVSEALSDEECERLVSQLNTAIGHLEFAENQASHLAQADAALSELARRFPNEPAAIRNLAICRILELDALTPDEARSDPVGAKGAIEAEKRLEPNSSIPHVLAARLALHLGDVRKSMEELEAAAHKAPRDPAVWYELYHAGEIGDDENVRATSRRALAQAAEVDPTNSYLLKQQLLALAADKDEQVLETLSALRKNIEPILPAVKQKVRVDFDDIARKLAAAVEQQKWPQVRNQAQTIENIIRSEEWVRSDLRRLRVHSLAFVVDDFSAEVCSERPSTAVPAEPRNVHWKAAASDRQLPDLAGVTDLNVADFDLDGTIDVIALSEREVTVVGRSAVSQPWEKLASVAVREPMRGLLVADLDRDVQEKSAALPEPQAARQRAPGETKPGDSAPAAQENESCQMADVEVVVFGPAGAQIFRNDIEESTGKRVLVEVDQDDDFAALRDVLAGVLADVDHDGDLDLVISSVQGVTLWQNVGKQKFAEITQRSALPPASLAATTLVAVDWDRDLDIDILVAGPNDTPAGWLENLRHGSLRWRPFEEDLAKLTGSACLSLLEIDGNVSWDLIGAGPDGLHLARTRTRVPGSVEPLDFTDIAKEAALHSLVGDFDNDAHPDLLSYGEEGIRLFWGRSPKDFTPGEPPLSEHRAPVATVAVGDLDADGDLDLVVAEADKLVLYDNEGGNRNHWLAVQARGQRGDNQNTGDVNDLGIGSVIELKTGRQYQAQVVTGQVTHFGLGKNQSADVLRIIWTNGVPQPSVAPQSDLSLCRVHVISTSCPYFYAWNGERFEFCTDA